MSNAIHILFIGDIVGSSGRKILKEEINALKKEYEIDLIIANSENAAHGFGLTPPTAKEIFDAGVDIMTGGNHSWDKKEITECFKTYENRILRPANYPQKLPGQGSLLTTTKSGKPFGVVNVMGQIYMSPVDCPFEAVDREIEKLKDHTKFILVDIHAEATSEKRAMAYHLDGRVSAVVGTHTHVPTADEEIFRGGTGFLTDAGMTGDLDSIIGMKTEIVLGRFVTKRSAKMDVADGKGTLQGVLFSLDSQSGKCVGIQRIKRPKSRQL